MLDKNSIEDKKVIRRIQSGEAEDSQILIEKYYQEIFRFSYYMTGNKEDAYDCTQETFLKMIRYIGQYKEMQKFKGCFRLQGMSVMTVFVEKRRFLREFPKSLYRENLWKHRRNICRQSRCRKE